MFWQMSLAVSLPVGARSRNPMKCFQKCRKCCLRVQRSDEGSINRWQNWWYQAKDQSRLHPRMIFIQLVVHALQATVLSPLQARYVSDTIGTILDVMGFPLGSAWLSGPLGAPGNVCCLWAQSEITGELPVHLHQVSFRPQLLQSHINHWLEGSYLLQLRLGIPTVIDRRIWCTAWIAPGQFDLWYSKWLKIHKLTGAKRREWMGGWGLPGLLLVSQWIMPENSLLSKRYIKIHKDSVLICPKPSNLHPIPKLPCERFAFAPTRYLGH